MRPTTRAGRAAAAARGGKSSALFVPLSRAAVEAEIADSGGGLSYYLKNVYRCNRRKPGLDPTEIETFRNWAGDHQTKKA